MASSDSGRELRAAARAGDETGIRGLVSGGAPIDEPDEHGHAALTLAVIFGHIEATRLLLAAGADVDVRDRAGLTALMIAAAFPRPRVVQVLLWGGADVNAVADDGRTALLNAIWSAETTADVVGVLVDAGADVTLADENHGLSPLEWAAKVGKKDVAQVLARAEEHATSTARRHGAADADPR